MQLIIVISIFNCAFHYNCDPGPRLHRGKQHHCMWQLLSSLHYLHLSHYRIQVDHPRDRPGARVSNEKGQD